MNSRHPGAFRRAAGLRGPTPFAMRGLTLMELVLTVVILAVIAAAVAPVATTGIQAMVQGRDLATAESEATLALERFVRDVRRARSIQEPPDGSLRLELPEGDVTYRLANGRLTRGERDLARRVDTDSSGSYFRVNRIPANNNEEGQGKQHVTLSLRMETSGVPYRATGAPR